MKIDHKSANRLTVKDLINIGLINKVELAKQLWPDEPGAETKLNDLAPADELRIKKLLKPILGIVWRKL